MNLEDYYDPTAWRLVPGRTAHVVIDDQNDFLHPQGWYATHDIDISHLRRVIEPTKALNEECRRRGVPIIWTRHGTRGVEDGGPFMLKRKILLDGGLRKDTWGYEVLEDLAPQQEDWYVEKTRLSAFYQTNLEQLLRALNAETVILTGVLTNQCVGATCKDAMFRDFKPIVVEEATGTATPHLHEPAIEMMNMGWGQVNTLEQTLAELREFPLAEGSAS
ncbi:MAG: cysteine hydrolase [Thermoleophilia bacterium]